MCVKGKGLTENEAVGGYKVAGEERKLRDIKRSRKMPSRDQ